MSITVTNQRASQSLKGQSVKVTLNGADAVAYLNSLEERELCTVDPSGNTGTIASIDRNGNSFKVAPITPDAIFSSGGGYLAAGETVTVGEVSTTYFILLENGNALITESSNNLILE